VAVGGILYFVTSLFEVLTRAFHGVATGGAHGTKQKGNDREEREICFY